MADPEAFDGTQTKLRSFKNRLALVLAEQDRFVGCQYRLRVCFGLFTREAYTTVEPHLKEGIVGMKDTSVDVNNHLAFLAWAIVENGDESFWRLFLLASGRWVPWWGPIWKPTKLITKADRTTASAIHQLRLGHGYFKPFLTRLPLQLNA